MRRKTRVVSVRGIPIGGECPVTVQSMTNTDTRDVESTVRQIRQLSQAGCDIVRVAVPDEEAAAAIQQVRDRVDVPLVGDIHFDSQLAISTIEAGVDKIRINPGNLRPKESLPKVVEAAGTRGIPIRVGVNAGSLDRKILASYGRPTPEALAESALIEAEKIESLGFHDVVISAKASSVSDTVACYRLLSSKTDFPLHIGITEAGLPEYGTVKSSVGLGILLSEGIGDTMRVSLAGDPIVEVKVAQDILKALGLGGRGPEVIVCPTCGRTEIDVVAVARAVEEKTRGIERPIRIAICGCVVNGPGEAAEADIGLCGGKEGALIIKGDRIIDRVPADRAVDALLAEIDKLASEGP